jgi:hypothetical protein
MSDTISRLWGAREMRKGEKKNKVRRLTASIGRCYPFDAHAKLASTMFKFESERE